MFSKIGATVSNKYHAQLQKGICCNEKPEAATIGILLKKTSTFIRKRFPASENQHSVTNFAKDGNF